MVFARRGTERKEPLLDLLQLSRLAVEARRATCPTPGAPLEPGRARIRARSRAAWTASRPSFGNRDKRRNALGQFRFGPAVARDEIGRSRDVLREPAGIHQQRARRRQLRFFARARRQLAKLVRCVREIFDLARTLRRAARFIASSFRAAATNAACSGGNIGGQRCMTAERVEQRAMRGGVEQAAIVGLAVHLDKQRRRSRARAGDRRPDR